MKEDFNTPCYLGLFLSFSKGVIALIMQRDFCSSEKWVKPFMVVYALVAIVGATMDLGMLWSIAETFNGLMAIPNLIALFLLSGTVVKLVKDYFARQHK